MGKVLPFALGLFVFISGCGEKPQEHKETVYVFGTLVEFVIRGVEKEVAQKAITEIDQEFQHMHKDWHAWKPGELTNLNQALARGEAMAVSPFLLPLIVQAKEHYRISDGLFNPAIGALISAWGFHRDELPKGSLPPLDKIKALATTHPSMDDIQISGNLVSSTNKNVHMDFGGFAKGVALDRAVNRLREMGIKSAVVNAGGDLNTLGSAGDRPWKIGIRHPVNWGVIASVEMREDENLYTSGNYERYREHEGIKYAHILHPETGMPVNHIVSASVIHKDGGLADAAATALTVAGPENWHRIAKKMGIKFVLLVDEKGTVYLNPAMKDRTIFAKDEPKKLVISDPL
ncbi:MAG: FAD:protein FMN transferase [Rhodospirillales bacterium]|nr:FAD:protein FMN transferase [Rhodospirillales bacterium]